MKQNSMLVVWAAMLAAIGMYAVVIAVVGPAGDMEDVGTTAVGLLVVALGLAGASLAVGRFMTEWPSYVLVRCALAEAIALFGFILAYLGSGWALAAPFFALGVVSMVAAVPTARAKERFDEAIERRRRMR